LVLRKETCNLLKPEAGKKGATACKWDTSRKGGTGKKKKGVKVGLKNEIWTSSKKGGLVLRTMGGGNRTENCSAQNEGRRRKKVRDFLLIGNGLIKRFYERGIKRQ